MIKAKKIEWSCEKEAMFWLGIPPSDNLEFTEIIHFTIKYLPVEMKYESVFHLYTGVLCTTRNPLSLEDSKLWCQDQLNSFIQSIAEEI